VNSTSPVSASYHWGCLASIRFAGRTLRREPACVWGEATILFCLVYVAPSALIVVGSSQIV
jgi:hypothetical protein